MSMEVEPVPAAASDSRNGRKNSAAFGRLVPAGSGEVEVPVGQARLINWLIRRVRG